MPSASLWPPPSPSAQHPPPGSAATRQRDRGGGGGGVAGGPKARTQCFHVLGFDLMLCHSSQQGGGVVPHLLEVNNTPSLAIDSVYPVVSRRSCAWIGSPRLRHCVHGAPIGRTARLPAAPAAGGHAVGGRLSGGAAPHAIQGGTPLPVPRSSPTASARAVRRRPGGKTGGRGRGPQDCAAANEAGQG
eukprot:COSAG01_NODE_4606_length_4884_cov_3.073981_5_plen_188_part_00